MGAAPSSPSTAREYRAPEPQGGYKVVFQPLRDGLAAGEIRVFAGGFVHAIKEPGQAAFRPTGLSQAPDGAFYISDDVHGRIGRVTYRGPRRASAAATPKTTAAHAEPGPPGGVNPNADVNALPVTLGTTRQHVALDQHIVLGQLARGTCSACHGSDGCAGAQAPSLVSGRHFVGNGTFQSSRQVVTDGLPRPRDYEVPMPPKGGAPLKHSDVTAAAAYVWAIGHAHH